MPSCLGAGSFLIASPTLRDPNFSRTVVLLCDHDAEGSMGLVVNRPSPTSLAEIVEGLEAVRPRRLYVGGPVQPQIVLVLHDALHVAGARSICDGVVLGGDEQTLLEMLQDPQHESIRVFSGYAGWGAGQLDSEFAEGSWIPCAASASFVFDVPSEDLWNDVMRSLGPQYAHLATLPLDPRVN